MFECLCKTLQNYNIIYEVFIQVISWNILRLDTKYHKIVAAIYTRLKKIDGFSDKQECFV
jgi:hypothetical protein